MMESFKATSSRRSDRNSKRRYEDKCNEDQEDELKRLGLFEDGMTLKEKQRLMSVIEESRKFALNEANVRQQHAKSCDQFEAFTASSSLSKNSDSSKLESLDIIHAHCVSPDLFADGEQEQVDDIAHSKQHDMDFITDEKETSGKSEGLNDVVGGPSLASNAPMCITNYKTDSNDKIDPFNCSDHSSTCGLRSTKRMKLQSKCRAKNNNRNYCALRIMRNLEKYYQKLYAIQRQSLDYLKWGKPIPVGRHMEDTIDVFNRVKNFSTKYITDDTLKKEGDNKSSSDSQDEEDDVDDSDFHPPKVRSNIGKRIRACKINSTERSDALDQNVGSLLKRPNESIDFKLEEEEEEEEKKVDDANDTRILEADIKPSISNRKKPDNLIRSETTAEMDVQKMQDPNKKVDSVEDGATVRFSYHKLRLGRSNKLSSSDAKWIESKVIRSPSPSTSAISCVNDEKSIMMSSFKVKSNRVGLGKLALNKPSNNEEKVAALRMSPLEPAVGDVRSKPANLENPCGIRKKLNLSQVKKLCPLSKKAVTDSSKELVSEQPCKRQRINEAEDGSSDSNKSTTELIPTSQPSPESAVVTIDELPDLDQADPNGGDKSDRYPCPLCGLSFSLNVIESHAADCQGLQDEPALETRTPKNKIRCYVCRGTFSENGYKDHVHQCIANKKLLLQSAQNLCSSSSPPSFSTNYLVQRCKTMNPTVTLVNCLDDHTLNNVDEPVILSLGRGGVSRFPLTARTTMGSTLNDGNISMSHIATSPFTTFQPISMQKESGIDFRNQFCKGGTSRQVLTKKRKSFKRKKRFVQKTHRSKKH